MIRKFSAVVICVILCFSAFNHSAFAYSAQCYVLYDPESGRVLDGRNAKMHHSMASTTKIMTALLLCEDGNLHKIVTVNAKAVRVEGTSVGLKDGDKITREALLYGLLLESGNDAANAIAYELGGNIKNFAKMMNDRAKLIGMTGTHFVTPSGLDDKAHYTTAYDMALLAAAAMNNDSFRTACSSKTYRAVYNGENSTRTYSNHNRLLYSLEGAEGIKTGFTKKSGRCLVSSCKRLGKRLIAVTLNAGDDWNDHKALYDYGFSQYEKVVLDSKFDFKPLCVAGGKESCVKLSAKPVEIMLHKDEISRAEYIIEQPRFAYAPLLCSECVGYVRWYVNGREVAKSEIMTENAVAKQDINEPGVGEIIINWIKIMISFS